MKLKQRCAPLNRLPQQLPLLDMCTLCLGTKLIPKRIPDVRRRLGFRLTYVSCPRCK
jgi:hypothetical protein